MTESGVTARCRPLDTMLLAPFLDMQEFLSHLLRGEPGHMWMSPRVVPDFKTHPVQFHDFLPGDIVLVVAQEPEAFGHVESGPKPMFSEHPCHERPVRLVAIIKGQDHESIGDFPPLLALGKNHHRRSRKGNQ